MAKHTCEHVPIPCMSMWMYSEDTEVTELTLFMSLFVLECWAHWHDLFSNSSTPDSFLTKWLMVELGYVKYRLKPVKPPDFPNHWQHTQTEDEVECHSYGPDFSPHYHQKTTGGNDGTLSCRNMPVAETHLVTCLRRISPQTWAMHWLKIFRIFPFPWPCAKRVEIHTEDAGRDLRWPHTFTHTLPAAWYTNTHTDTHTHSHATTQRTDDCKRWFVSLSVVW